jgi:glycosyltransferase involved in cell wall biosynthesis
MKLAIVASGRPFVPEDGDQPAEALLRKLNDAGHAAVLIRLPFRSDPPDKVVEHALACRSMRLENVDRVIGLNFPAHYLQHRDKVLWQLRRYGEAYELWDTPFQKWPRTVEAQRIREVVQQSDRRFLPENRVIYAVSEIARERLRKFNDIESEVLPYTPAEGENLRCETYGDVVFVPGPISRRNRQLLAVEAMGHVKTRVRLLVAGAVESREEAAAIEAAIARDGLHRRVRFLPRPLAAGEKAEMLAGCLACGYIPFDEEACGYSTLEAFCCRKPVITCTDSTGTAALVTDGESGRVVPPGASAIAEAMDRLFNDRRLARRLGEAAYELVPARDAAWDEIVERLTS